jgi:hypothetical protein
MTNLDGYEKFGPIVIQYEGCTYWCEVLRHAKLSCAVILQCEVWSNRIRYLV